VLELWQGDFSDFHPYFFYGNIEPVSFPTKS